MERTITASPPALRFSHVSKYVQAEGRREYILKDISGEVPRGVILTIIGPSGAGKSTLLSLCNLLQSCDEGEIEVEGKEVRQWSVSALRRHVGMVFQTPTMLPGTVYDNIAIGAQLCGQTVEKPEEILRRVGLSPSLLGRKAQELSGGEKQRVALARTLVTKPSILLLDEVTAALDPTSAREVEEWIVSLNREEGLTVVWVTHQLEQARRVGDLTWVIVQGQLVESGPSDALFSRPQQETTRLFLAGQLAGGKIQ